MNVVGGRGWLNVMGWWVGGLYLVLAWKREKHGWLYKSTHLFSDHLTPANTNNNTYNNYHETENNLTQSIRRVVRVSDWLPDGFNPDALLVSTAPTPMPTAASEASCSSSGGGGAVSDGGPQQQQEKGGGGALCEPLCVDARAVGNVARFIRPADPSKGEKPNLLKQAVFTTSRNPYAPRLAFFAAEDIPAGSELLR